MSYRNRIVVVIICSICVIANCLYHYGEHPEHNRTVNHVDGMIQGIDEVGYSAAGWPWSFYEHLERGELTSWYRWNWIALAGDTAFWVLIFVIAWWNSRSHHPSSIVGKTRARWRLSLADLFVLMLVVASVFGYLARNRVQYAESQKLIRSIRSLGGAASEAYYWPKVLPDDFIVNYFLPRERIVGVAISDPTDTLLREIVALPYLRSLCLSGVSYSLTELRPLLRNPHIQYLRISRREIDQATIEMIGQSKSLQALSLTDTNITDSILLHLGEMPNLRFMNLGHTKIELNETSIQPWMKSVRYLRLPRPSFGDTPAFRLDGWPELLDLRMMEHDEQLPPQQVVGLSVSKCPKLEKITVIDSQRFDFQLQGLPRFKEILVRTEDSSGDLAQTLPVRNLRFQDLPSIAAVNLETWGLDQIRIENCPQLQCNAFWTPEVVTGQAAVALGFGGGYSNVRPASSIEAQSLIRSLNQSTGITSLNLCWLPIKDLDLSPITACNTIKSLNLPPGVSTEQLRQLSPLRGIEAIQIAMATDFQTMIESWPNLRRIEGNANSPISAKQAAMRIKLPYNYGPFVKTEMHLSSAMHLESVLFGNFRESTSLHLEDLPHLNDIVQVSKNIESIRVKGLPKLKGLLTASPWPLDASIDSMPELQVFSAGGPRFNDDTFSAIAKSLALRSLTLGHCGMTPERLAEIGNFVNLTALGLSGSSVTDTTVESWSVLKGLQTLMLDRTQVTSQSIPWICSLRLLKHLSIDSHCVAAITPEQLDSLSHLTSISFHGDGIAMEKLAGLSSWRNLQTLRIENAKLTKQMLAQLLVTLPKSVLVLDLCFCKIVSEDLEEFVPGLSNAISLGVEGLEVSEELQAELLRRYRAVIESDADCFVPNSSNYSVRSSSWPIRKTDNPLQSIRTSDILHNITNRSLQDMAGLVKPSLFAPSEKTQSNEK